MTSDPNPNTRSSIEPSDIFFSPSVKAVQARRGSRANYAAMAESDHFETEITPDLAAWLAERDSFYLATANTYGQPYIQHRGGPRGFLRVLDRKTLAFADYRGNRQFITLGNLAENNQAMMFLMDYANRNRIKIWGTAKVVEDENLIRQLMPEGYKARPEQVILFTVDVWDSNCAQHIPQKVNLSDATPLVQSLKDRIKDLETQLAALSG